MRRDRGGHTDGNTVGTIEQNIRYPDRKYFRLLLILIKVWNKIDDILVEVREKDLLRDLHQTGFRVTHGSRTVSLDRAEVSVTVHQDLTFLEILGHHDQ